MHIRSLETAVDAPLFDRLPAGVRLTEAGRQLLPLSERMLELAGAATTVGRHDGETVGELVVAAPETVVAHHLPPVLRELRDRHPGLKVRLSAVPYADVPDAVVAGDVDVGYLLQPPLRSTSMLTVAHLATEPLALIAGADHPLAKPPDDLADAFARTTLFLTERGCGYRSLFEAHLDAAGVRAGDTLEFGSVEAIRRCVEAGLGVALIPARWVEEPLRRGTVVEMDWFASGLGVAVQLCWHPARWRSPALAAVIAASERRITDAG